MPHSGAQADGAVLVRAVTGVQRGMEVLGGSQGPGLEVAH